MDGVTLWGLRLAETGQWVQTYSTVTGCDAPAIFLSYAEARFAEEEENALNNLGCVAAIYEPNGIPSPHMRRDPSKRPAGLIPVVGSVNGEGGAA